MEALGRSRGGFTTKLHARCDRKGRPLGFVLTPGQAHDIQGFGPLFRMIADRIETLLADKGYDSDAIREEIAKAGVEAGIPAKSNRRAPTPHDREKYRWRNLVERLFNKLKNWRRIATRYDKTKESYLGFVAWPQSNYGCPLSTKPSTGPTERCRLDTRYFISSADFITERAAHAVGGLLAGRKRCAKKGQRTPFCRECRTVTATTKLRRKQPGRNGNYLT
ncbi:IS5 family transposase [Mesorhizobium sp. M1A.F.Ca.ET.072.01.1.1]|uniref:IS5 family transposase n=1 Tax=Mesorhizobium sp. M1A.F.Ca.ET.072.01.1.1 TaxID=2496753 RepID=UPI001FDEAF3C|nr:IS5 family transposase [Mesorhizobium sp. M1A.F.Ca.ET.072.01.1.1]